VKLRPLLGPDVAAWYLEQEVKLEQGEHELDRAVDRALERVR
jgi:hypothetical protein